MKILLVQDSDNSDASVEAFLKKDDWEVVRESVELRFLGNEIVPYDLIVVHTTHPDKLEDVIRRIKAITPAPIFVCMPLQKNLCINLLGVGADDCITLPCHVPELRARCKALVRRQKKCR